MAYDLTTQTRQVEKKFKNDGSFLYYYHAYHRVSAYAFCSFAYDMIRTRMMNGLLGMMIHFYTSHRFTF